ncbi:uncharacterized protein LOC132450224 isoform X7 [Gadus macrocephalus]|uniref:uncharacterized protein LOC132450224 isoform X7 n=1 Tax=Gadus macrocephalus TaxID=80720 RepID=UPI0028CB9642|nr:uncharacterized protein LOC132450224 isoform X7 [Gadus macrocephalus]
MFGVPLCSIGLLLVALIHTAVTKSHHVMGGVGHSVILPCVSPLDGSCSDIRWYHHSTQGVTTLVARIPRREAANSGRFNILSNCFLRINNITEVDVGGYGCSKDVNETQYLSLITDSSLLRSDLLPGANITLSCNLNTFEGPGWCFSPLYQGMSLKWQDDNRPDYMLAEQRTSKCAVRLNVILQRGSRFSCLALVNRQVQNRVQFPVRIRDGDGGNSEVIGRVIAVTVVSCAMTVVLALILVKKRKPNDQLAARPECTGR